MDEIRAYLKTKGRRVLLQLATGGGKTFIFSTVLKGCHENKVPCLMVVGQRHLVDQASFRLNEMDVPHGVYMADHPEFNDAYPIQVCSIQTMRSRQVFPAARFVIIDEAHTATSKQFIDFLDHYQESIWISVTATPQVPGALKHLADHVVYPISISELFEQGYLVPPKYFGPTKFDVSNLKLKNGEFIDEQSLEEFERGKIYGDVTKYWEQFAKGTSSLCFAINIKHSLRLLEAFTSVGARAVAINAKWSLEERKEHIRQLECGELDVIINVGTMTTGVDIPSLRNIIFCRPTNSKLLYTQMLGRGTRKVPGKDHFKVIDHVGNVQRHGPIEDETKHTFNEPQRRKKGVSVGKNCPECFAYIFIFTIKCPECGHMFDKKAIKELEQIHTGMKEIKIIKDQFIRRAWSYWKEVLRKNQKPWRVWFLLVEEFGEEETIKRGGKRLCGRIKAETERIRAGTSKYSKLHTHWTGEKEFLPDLEAIDRDGFLLQ